MKISSHKARMLLSRYLGIINDRLLSYTDYANLPQVQSFIGINEHIKNRSRAAKLIRRAVCKKLPLEVANVIEKIQRGNTEPNNGNTPSVVLVRFPNKRKTTYSNNFKHNPSVADTRLGLFYKSWDWKRLRYDFIKNNQRRCQCCGATPEDGAKIVVDHIKPIRLFWDLRFDINNLQLLCNDCNMGKGSCDQTDWRNVAKFPVDS